MSQRKWYNPPVDQLLTLGDPREREERGVESAADYRSLGLDEADGPELIRMATDKRLHSALDVETAVWGPLHAWRALGQMQMVEAVEPLLELLDYLAKREDEWGLEELPVVLGMIGTPVLEPVALFLANATKGLFARVAAARAFGEIATRFPDCRGACVDHLTRQLARAKWNDPTLNAFLVSTLLDLQAVESAHAIERAYTSSLVDETVVGRWDDVRAELGIEPSGFASFAGKAHAPDILGNKGSMNSQPGAGRRERQNWRTRKRRSR